MAKKLKGENVNIVSVSCSGVTLSYELEDMFKVRIESLRPDGKLLFETDEYNRIGRINIEGLRFDTDHVLKISWGDNSQEVSFKTLEKPVGDMMSSYAVLSDPHISIKGENRKGRMFVESALILREIVNEINGKVEFVLIAGDITNDCEEREFDIACDILDRLNCSVLAVPGDHDREEKDKNLWVKYFGDNNFCREIGDYRVIGVDTAFDGLDEEGVSVLKEVNDEKINLILSHCQLWPDEYIITEPKAKSKLIDNYQNHQSYLKKIFDNNCIVYAGHQNVPSIVRMGNSIQVNVAQPLQYPCGYLIVERYSNGLYHRFVPISSEVFRAYSKKASDRACELYGEKQWDTGYRAGKDYSQSNFIYQFER